MPLFRKCVKAFALYFHSFSFYFLHLIKSSSAFYFFFCSLQGKEKRSSDTLSCRFSCKLFINSVMLDECMCLAYIKKLNLYINTAKRVHSTPLQRRHVIIIMMIFLFYLEGLLNVNVAARH